MGFEGYDVVLPHGVLNPLEVLERLRVRIVEQRVQIVVEHPPAAAVNLAQERRIEVGNSLIVLIDERVLHARRLELEAGLQDIVPSLGHGDAVLIENLLVEHEGD